MSKSYKNKNNSLTLKLTVFSIFSLLSSTLLHAAETDDIIDVIVDGGNDYPWDQIEIPGTICSDGSQYKFWVYDSPSSDNLVIVYEGGGACWDYETCSGAAGLLGAANPNGLADDYITSTQAKYVSPLVNGVDPGFPGRAKTPLVTDGWDVVYMPYCTGDIHVGNNVTTYHDPTGENPPILFHHNGYNNSVASLNYLAERFPNIDKLMITGYSAGGVASSAGYYIARNTLKPKQGYMLNDSGPLFPAPDNSYNSRYLHEKIREAWNLDTVFSELPAGFDPNDVSSINDFLASEFPDDQLAYTAYSSDFNFSRFSYERFYPGIDEAGILEKWREDQANLLEQLEQHPNYSYHVPWHRPINESHCSTIATFVGSHSCPSIRKKHWYEYPAWPWTQTWTCPGDLNPLEEFLERWVNNREVLRFVEPENNYNNEDPGMSIIAPLINGAISG